MKFIREDGSIDLKFVKDEDTRRNILENYSLFSILNEEFQEGKYILDGYFECSIFYNENEALIKSFFELPSFDKNYNCLLYTSPSPRDATLSRMPSSA